MLMWKKDSRSVLQCVLQRVLQCVTVCCSMLQCDAVCCSVLHYFADAEAARSQPRASNKVLVRYVNMCVREREIARRYEKKSQRMCGCVRVLPGLRLVCDKFRCKSHNPGIHQNDKLKFLGFSLYRIKLRCRFNLNLYREIWAF